MRNKRTVKFLKQKSYMIAAVLMLAAAFGMTGVYFSQQSKEKKAQEQEIAAQEEQAKQAELAKAEKEIKESEEVSRVITSKSDDFMDSPEDISDSAQNDNEEDDRQVASAKNATETETDALNEEVQEEELEEVSAGVAVPELHFSAETDLNWPLQGNVILNYSMEQTVYFATLDQYKLNPAIIIQAGVNDKVLSVAKGTISSIVTDEVTGHTVTVDLGDGYSAVYGQLKEIPFVEGDYVDVGEIVGYVSEPTKYFSVEGSNVYFQLLKDGEPQDPMQYLN